MSDRRDSVLREMGLAPLWRLRSRTQTVADNGEKVAEKPAFTPRTPANTVEEGAARKRPPQLTTEKPETVPAGVSPDPLRAARISGLDWEELEADMRSCKACPLWEQRQQVVPGSGDRKAGVMFVGEGPGAEEDRRGQPFVGAAGKLLDAMLAAIGMKRDDGVYIANTVKCRPPHNRTPHNDEMAACLPYLERQIALVQPRLLVALGRPAAQVLLNAPDVRINASRGKELRHGSLPLLVTYHPAYLLRNQADKARAWEDLCLARKTLARLTAAPDEGDVQS